MFLSSLLCVQRSGLSCGLVAFRCGVSARDCSSKENVGSCLLAVNLPGWQLTVEMERASEINAQRFIG